ncbi:calpain small subunit 2-like [Saccoglossus kowalevskii]|uniref:Calpain small subunit 2-like n=1 Tax=Saccoglossus kowalevskii TaxID=10224 RepID=A0ABM0GKQ9_SACKO|nr:PREDICTED: calpain small subunit 2-like [Saccoglossus kowalevskii]
MSGKLGFDEFKELWKNIRAWKLIFREFDRDNSGSFNTHELRAALRSVGFRLSHKAFGALVLRYGNKSGLIDFNSFIHCSVKMKGMFRAFNEHESGGQTRMAVDEFMHVTMYS